jgi:hypothetical protein
LINDLFLQICISRPPVSITKAGKALTQNGELAAVTLPAPGIGRKYKKQVNKR